MRLQGEKETLGLYLTGHPVAEYAKELKAIGCNKVASLRPQKGVKRLMAGIVIAMRTLITKRGDKMAFITIDDSTARQEVAIFSDLYDDVREFLKKDEIVVVQGEIAHDEYTGGLRARAYKIFTFSDARMHFAKCLIVRMQAGSNDDRVSENIKATVENNDKAKVVAFIQKLKQTLYNL